MWYTDTNSRVKSLTGRFITHYHHFVLFYYLGKDVRVESETERRYRFQMRRETYYEGKKVGQTKVVEYDRDAYVKSSTV